MDEYVAKMDRAGIERSLLIAVRAGDMRVKYSFAIPYERVAGYCEQFPGASTGSPASTRVRACAAFGELERGRPRVRLRRRPPLPALVRAAPRTHAKYYPFYAKCCELDVPIMMQIGHCLDYQRDRVLPSVGRPITLDRVAIDFPELKLIGIHLGWPWTEEMIAICFKHNNVYMAGDAYAPKHWPDSFVHYIDSWGQDKCLFGTDWPVIDPERAMQEIDQLPIREASRAKFLCGNAVRLFRLPEPPDATPTGIESRAATPEPA